MLQEGYDQFRKGALIAALEAVCEQLELTDAQFLEAKNRYEGVGGWLAEGSHPALANVLIYVQGSTAIGTTVRPIGRDEFDVDLIARLSCFAGTYPPDFIKGLIGDRLKEHGTYERLLEEMCRCWRLGYANRFHLDITPSVPNPDCPNGGELVPDRELRSWKASNPRGYRDLFAKRAALVPRLRLQKSVLPLDEAAKAAVEPYPEQSGFRGVLRRTVQITKRHRDVHFQRRPNECAPISVIVTTLLAKSYERCATSRVYADELEMLVAVIQGMTDFVEHDAGEWFIWNETTAGENFAEKWNAHPDRAKSFFAWHGKLVADMKDLQSIEGLDRIANRLEEALGEGPTKVAVAHLEETVTAARNSGVLRYAAPGLVAAPAAAATSVSVPKNTFYGR
ncbi:MAG: nucleotidyltransferase [Erythrobacter sp.]|nr:nucleotidyltransferase [Erythrobacter sp.]